MTLQMNRLSSGGRSSEGSGAGGSPALSPQIEPLAADPCPQKLPNGFQWSLDRSCDVGRALLAASRRFREAEIDTPQLDSALLLGHVLGVSKSWIYAHPQRQLTAGEIERFEALARRRMCQEPIAYLVGYRSFYGLDINVDHHVLIPRPETEQLVDRVLDRIQYLVSCGRKPTVADIGTGSGAVAVAVALNAPGVPVYAVDISDAALAVANQNVWRYGLSEQVQCIPGNLLEALPGPVDIIVANLPYVATADLATLSRQVRDYEPHVALDGGPDGLQVIRSLFDELVRGAASKLRHDGRIYLEIGHDQGRAVQQLAELALPGCAVEILTDLAGLDRIVVISQ